MEERLTCLEEKLSSIQLSLEMLPDLLTRWDDRYSHDGGDDGDDGNAGDQGVCETSNGKEEEGGEGMEASCFLK